MTPIDIQVSRSKVNVEGQTYSLYVGEGGISVLQTAIFGMYTQLTKPFQVTPRYMNLWPWPWPSTYISKNKTLTFAIIF